MRYNLLPVREIGHLIVNDVHNVLNIIELMVFAVFL